jgi:multiple sugar transport system ATP-binding protein
VKLRNGTEIETQVPPAALPQDGPLRVGLRPESMKLCAAGDGHTQAVVDFVEFMGDRTHVYLSLSSEDRIVAVDGASFAARTGETVGIRFDRNGVHLFDADGRNCRRPV